ncbi:hypothetical protein 1 [Beihai picorna-like virus 93]|uniref:hypothetical protein 1 n=1 Tax=Beihai picorna-like virus 93 TaxID=1922639 RepID=UPI00090A5FA0|nr:hypothetical protein 1 [Beihai picorna-like virus 93]APG76720.1 hypothetical protein 1 [Beihai picorna-like virus 93]
MQYNYYKFTMPSAHAPLVSRKRNLSSACIKGTHAISSPKIAGSRRSFSTVYKYVPSFSDFVNVMYSKLLPFHPRPFPTRSSQCLDRVVTQMGDFFDPANLVVSSSTCDLCSVFSTECFSPRPGALVAGHHLKYNSVCKMCIAAKHHRLGEKYPFSFPPTYHSFGQSVIPDTHLHYTGILDVFACVKCNGYIFGWEANDDPIAEHARLYPQCSSSPSSSSSRSKCCPLECFPPPSVHMDGIFPCCGSSSFCRCQCVSYRLSRDAARDIPNILSYLQALVQKGKIPNFSWDTSAPMDEMPYSRKAVLHVASRSYVGFGDSLAKAKKDAARAFFAAHPAFAPGAIRTQMLGPVNDAVKLFSETALAGQATLSHINEVVEDRNKDVKQLVDISNCKLSELSRSASKTLDGVNSFLPKVQSIIDGCESIVSKLQSWLPGCDVDTVGLLKDLLTAFIFSLLQRSFSPILQALTAFGLRHSFFLPHISALRQLYSSLIAGDHVETQIGTECLDTVRETLGGFFDQSGKTVLVALSAILSFVCVVCLGIKDFSSATFNSLLVQSSLVGRALVGVRSFKDLFFGIYDFVDNQCCILLYGKTRAECDIERQYPRLKDLLEVCTYFHGEIDVNMLLGTNSAACELVRDAGLLLDRYIDKAIALQHRDVCARLKENRSLMKGVIEKANLYLSCGSGYRVPPVTVMLHGPAGCGKTEMSKLLQEAIRSKYYPDIKLSDLVFSRKSENEYWDGVQLSSRIFLYDDAFQIVDTTAKPNPEFMEIIRLANSESYQLHMSAVADKGSMYARPSFVLATTNVPDPQPKSIHCVEALQRRFDLKVHVKLNRQFAVDSGRTDAAGNPMLMVCPKLVWLAQNPGKTQEDLHAALRDNTFVVTPDSRVYLCDITLSRHNRLEEYIDYTFEHLRDFMFDLYEMKQKAHADKVDPPIPSLPEDLSHISPLTQQGSDISPVAPSNPLPDTIYLPPFLPHFSTDAYLDCFNIADGKTYTLAAGVDCAEYVPSYTRISEICGMLTESSFAHNVETFEWAPSLRERAVKTVSSLYSKLVSLSPFQKLREFISNHWGMIALFIGAAGIATTSAILWSKGCRIQKALKEGAPASVVVCTKTCMVGCSLCKQIRTANVCMNLTTRTDGSLFFKPRDVRRAGIAILAAAEKCGVEVNTAFSKSLLSEDFVVERGVDHGFILGEPLESCVPESHQDARLVQRRVESHQDARVLPRRVEQVVESHQDVQPRARRVEAKSYTPTWTDLCTEASMDWNATQTSQKLLSKNMVRCYIPGTPMFVHGIFIRGRCLLTVQHFVDKLDNNLEIERYADPQQTRVPVPILATHPVTRNGEACDLVILELGASVIAAPDITSYFPLSSELSSLKGLVSNGDLRMFSSTRLKVGLSPPLLIPRDSSARLIDVFDVKAADDDYSGRVYYTRSGMECAIQSVDGDCGSPYILFNPCSRAKIMSLHTAGCSGRGFSQIVTQEDLRITPRTQCATVTTVYPHTDAAVSPLPNSIPIGKVQRAPQPSKTEIRPSPIHGVYPIRKGPAVLYDHKENLLLKNSLKVVQNTKVLREDLIDICVHDVIRTLNQPGINQEDKRILTHAESITGLEGREYVNPLNRATSAGYPYSLRKAPGKPGKKTWLGDQEYDVSNVELLEHVEDIIDKASRGIVDVELGIFQATLKDERRTLDKLAAKKTRVFAASNQGLALAIRRYFGTYMEHIMVNRITNEIGLGTNVYSADWSRIVQRLRNVSPHVIAGDFSNFDGSLNSQLLCRVAEIVTDWYDDDNGMIRATLMEYLFNASWLIDDHVIQLNHSQPSGNPLTTMINCIYNMLIFRYCYLLLLERMEAPLTLSGFRSNVACVFYGDDSICAISPSVKDWYNQLTITEAMAITGHTYTDETKSGSPPPFRSLHEVTFLKRHFVLRDGMWIAPLSKETIEDMIMWTRKNLDAQEALVQVTRTASFEASLHSREYFEQFCATVRKACRTAGYGDALLHYNECEQFIRHQQGRGEASDKLLLAQLMEV